MKHIAPALMATVALTLPLAATAQRAGERPDRTAFRSLYKELVETNTTSSVGDCTKAAQQVAARLRTTTSTSTTSRRCRS